MINLDGGPIDLDDGLDWTGHDHLLEFDVMENGAPVLPPTWSNGKAWIPTNVKVTVRWRPGDAPEAYKVEMVGWCVKKDGTAGKQSNSNYWYKNSFRPGWPDGTPEYAQQVADYAVGIVRKGWTS